MEHQTKMYDAVLCSYIVIVVVVVVVAAAAATKYNRIHPNTWP